MHHFGHVSEKCLADIRINALAALLRKVFVRDRPFVACELHHPPGEYQLVPPIEVSLEEADGAQLVDEVVATDLFQKHCHASAPSS